MKDKVKELFPEEDDSDLDNELLQTIYFPKKVKNIGYLTDKLPRMRYEEDNSMMKSTRKRSSDTDPSPPKVKSSLPLLSSSVSKKKDGRHSINRIKASDLKQDTVSSGGGASTIDRT